MELRIMSNKEVTEFGFVSKDVYTPFNAPCAIKYIDKVCYCADDYESLFENIKVGYKVRLKEICYKNELPASLPFKVEPINGGLRNNYRFIIPEEHVKLGLTYQPFKNYKQFVDETGFENGDIITIRRKSCQHVEISTCIVGVLHNNQTDYDFLYLGIGQNMNFNELFKTFELKDERKNVWIPFGSCKEDGE